MCFTAFAKYFVAIAGQVWRSFSVLNTEKRSPPLLVFILCKGSIYRIFACLWLLATYIRFNNQQSSADPELSGCITNLIVLGCKLLCSNGHLDRSRCHLPWQHAISLYISYTGFCSYVYGWTHFTTSHLLYMSCIMMHRWDYSCMTRLLPSYMMDKMDIVS